MSDDARYTKRRSVDLWKANRAFKVDGVRRLSVTMMCMLTDNIIGIFDILRRLELHMCSCVTTLFLLYYITMFTVAYLSRYNLHAHVCFLFQSNCTKDFQLYNLWHYFLCALSVGEICNRLRHQLRRNVFFNPKRVYVSRTQVIVSGKKVRGWTCETSQYMYCCRKLLMVSVSGRRRKACCWFPYCTSP